MSHKGKLLVAALLGLAAEAHVRRPSLGYRAPGAYAPTNRSKTKAPGSKRIRAKMAKAKKRKQ